MTGGAVVVDSSAVLDLLVSRPVAPGLVERLRGAQQLHAPHLIDLEVVNVLRRLTIAGALEETAADLARRTFAELPIERYAHAPFRSRIWTLRPSLTAYDAAYVALGEALHLPVVTCDARMARAHGHEATMEAYRS